MLDLPVNKFYILYILKEAPTISNLTISSNCYIVQRTFCSSEMYTTGLTTYDNCFYTNTKPSLQTVCSIMLNHSLCFV